jgi:hypothetical protein
MRGLSCILLSGGRRCMKHGRENPIPVAWRSAVMTEKPGDKHMPSLYARTWVLVFIWGGALLVPIGASLLFSFVPEVDWRV